MENLNLIKGIDDHIINAIVAGLPPHAEVETGSMMNKSGNVINGEKYSVATIDPETGEYAGHYIICYVWESDPNL